MEKENQKINLVLGVICSSSSVDQNTNNMSLHNIFDELTLGNLQTPQLTPEQYKEISAGKPKVMAVPFPHEIVTVWSNSTAKKTQAEMTIELIDPSENILAKHNPAVFFEDKKPKMRFFIKIQTIFVTKPGLYRYRISLKTSTDKVPMEVVTLPIEIRITI